MKKYWQIKPWILLIVILIPVAGLVYAFSSGVTSNSGNSSEIDSFMAPTRESQKSIYAPAPGAGVADKAVDGDTTTNTARMMIKTGSLSMVVNDVRKSIDEITKYVDGKGGFLVTSDVSKSTLEVFGNVTVRVPSKVLDETIAFVKTMGNVEDEHIDGQDVTEEYTDLEAKLGNLQATEKQFLEIMKSAVKIEDVLAVQKELSYVRENIESIKGRIKYLKESVDLSSLTVYLSTNPSTLPVIDTQDEWAPLAVFKDALRSLLDAGQAVVNALIWIGTFLPAIAVILLIVWLIRRRIKRRK